MTELQIKFEPNLEFQTEAIEAVCDLFDGQESCRTEFTVTVAPSKDQQTLEVGDATGGVGNRLMLSNDDVLDNLKKVQERNGLRPSDALESGDFSVEMETGTGKTYVYLRTIFELNKRFGHTKFIIVVPSVAIKEGVNKTLEMTEEHFQTLYSGTPLNYFMYDSSRLDEVRNFATSSSIQVMIITVGAINKKATNKIYEDSEKTNGFKPIDLIRDTKPILIVDEPQSVDGGLKGSGKEALEAMEPLCTLRYSATHADKHNMVYRLDAIDAYERELVKQIEVASATVENAGNQPYIRFLESSNKKGNISAKVELEIEEKSGTRTVEKTVYSNDDLEEVTGRSIYENVRVGEITTGKGHQTLEVQAPGASVVLEKGAEWGAADPEAVNRLMIRRTIKEHFDKELRLRPKGIKVLSLFFVDEVANYRRYDDDGNQLPGPYAEAFEEEFIRLANSSAYAELFDGQDVEAAAKAAHGGYFSIDRRTGKVADTSNSDDAAAEDAFNLIMKDKERLLELSEPLRFIFSHSALREGWDNPNVFQICSLREMSTERQRRQTIGRGLRLCVNQDGDRVHGFDTNTLTVVAREGYSAFAEGLQKEIEEETGIEFGVVESHAFQRVPTTDGDGNETTLGFERSEEVWKHFQEAGYIDANGKVQQALRTALDDGAVAMPDGFDDEAPQIIALLKKFASGLQIKDADERLRVNVNKQVLDSPEFEALWKQIRDKTIYRVEFDNDGLVEQCVEAIKELPDTPKTVLQIRKGRVSIGDGGVEATEIEGAETLSLNEGDIPVPDVLTDLQDRTSLTRRSIVRILLESGRLDELKRNPQAFIKMAANAINRQKSLVLVDGIKYERLGDDDYYAQELFTEEELMSYGKNLYTLVKKCVYAGVVFDSEVERNFATELENDGTVKAYVKLPGWFKIPTPLGSYNPDWAVLVEQNGEMRLYFVVETKSGYLGLREEEKAKIKCGDAHFAALREAGGEAEFKKKISTVQQMLS